jgi:multidrug resistance protein, MATE family
MTERTLIAKHAFTVWVGQLAVMAFGVTDTVVAGRYDPSALAALSVGSAVYISVFVTLMGLLQATLPILSELHGANSAPAMGRVMRQSIYIWAAASALGIGLLLNARTVLQWTEVPLALQPSIEHYLTLLAGALPPSLGFRLYGNLNQALGRPKAVTWVQLLGLCCKVPLSIALTFGLGLGSGLGVIGCALATLIVNWWMLAFALWALRRGDYQSLHLWRKLEAPDPKRLKEMLRLGLPNAGSITVEVTSYTLMALLISRLGSTAAASHQIMSNMGALLYMVPLSLSIATSARVSYWMGANQPAKARLALGQGLQWVVVCASVTALGLYLFKTDIARLYIQNEEVVAQADRLLSWLIWYLAVDALQVFFFFMLRCHRVTVVPMLIYACLLWGVGLTGGHAMAYHGLWGHAPMLNPQAFWISSSAALTVVSLLLGGLLAWVLSQRRSNH